MDPGNKTIHCLNCNSAMSRQAEYCEHCGQKKVSSVFNIFDLIKDFISNLFNLDGRLFKSFRHLWKPAFLAQEYINGTRKSYVNPIRFFLVMLVLQFFLVGISVNKEDIDKGTWDVISKLEQKKLALTYDSTVCSIIPDINDNDRKELRDSIFGVASSQSPIIWDGGNFFGWKIKSYPITKYDAYSMEVDSLFTKYDLTKWYDKLFIRQLVKIDKDRSGSLTYFIGKLFWGVLLTIFLIALLMKLLYIRDVYYYVEHLIIIILYCAKVLLVLNVISILQKLDFAQSTVWNILVLIMYLSMVLYFVLTLKNYYRQGKLKTLIKSMLISVASFYIVIISITIVTLLSLAFL